MYNLMLVDDEPIIRRSIKSMTGLKDLGIDEVIEAADAKEALSMLDRFKIDIVFLDINMPGIDGLSLAGMIKEKNTKIRIVMISGYDYFEYLQTAIRLGVDDYLLKPVSKSDIERLLVSLTAKIKAANVEDELKEILDVDEIVEDEFGKISAYLKEKIFLKTCSLSDMAEELNFNPNYLSGIFKKHYGIPFQEYIGIKRMEQAKLLLLSKDMKNAEIADAVGFEDVNYFISRFKKTYNISPKQYKSAVQKGVKA